MNARQKRTLKRLVSLLALLLVLLAAIRLVKSRQADRAAKAAAEAAAAGQVTDAGAEYTALSWDNGTAVLSFAVDDAGAWYWVDNRDFPLDDTNLSAICSVITGLSPQKTITQGDTLEAYGLDEPAATLTAATADGETQTFALGAQVPDSTDRYLLVNGDESTVYVISSSLMADLSMGIYEMMVLPELPVLTQTQFTSVAVTGAVKTTLYAQVSGGGSDGSAAQGTDSVTWRSGGKEVTEAAAQLVAAVTAPTLDACQDYDPTDAAASICGFDAPEAIVTVHYTESSGEDGAWTMSIAKATADGTGRYVRLLGDDTIYSMTSEALEPILSVAQHGLGA